MKRYLMTGVAALAFAATFTSCSNHDLYTEEQPKTPAEKYASAFENEFGSVNPNVDWGLSGIRSANTRAMSSNANEWWKTVNVPLPVNEVYNDEIAKVTDWFEKHPNYEGTSVNWSDFFIQQVSCTTIGEEHMNNLHCGASKDSKEHVENFNAGGTPDMKEVYTNNTEKYKDKIAYILRGGTGYFEYHNSLDSKEYSRYIVVAGETIDPRFKDWYYVGFDYESHGQDANQQVEPNGIFNDWIIRICPGDYKNDTRVFVEDLIATNLDDVESSDWDFNDAVFDAHFTKVNWPETKIYATITLRAAGGTLPLTIGGIDVHEAFGVDQNVMVNTGQTSRPIAIFTIETDVETIENIPVIVNGSTELKLVPGAATQKLVGPKVNWPSERVNIKGVYGNFVNYVNNNSGNWWD